MIRPSSRIIIGGLTLQTSWSRSSSYHLSRLATSISYFALGVTPSSDLCHKLLKCLFANWLNFWFACLSFWHAWYCYVPSRYQRSSPNIDLLIFFCSWLYLSAANHLFARRPSRAFPSAISPLQSYLGFSSFSEPLLVPVPCKLLSRPPGSDGMTALMEHCHR